MTKYLWQIVLWIPLCAFAAEPSIEFPKPAIVTPPPAPSPVGVVPVLTPDKVYAVQSESEFILTAIPRDSVKLTPATGPVRVRGVFTDGNGKPEWRTLEGKFIYFVDAVAEKGRVNLIAIPSGAESEEDLVFQLIDLGHGPQPPPDVDPQPDPDVDPDEPPAPIPQAGLRALIIEETADRGRLPASQLGIFSSTKIRKYVDQNFAKGPSSNPEFRIFDKDLDMSMESKTWQDAMKLPRDSLPWIIVSNGKTGYSGPLPKNEADVLSLFQKYEVK